MVVLPKKIYRKNCRRNFCEEEKPTAESIIVRKQDNDKWLCFDEIPVGKATIGIRTAAAK